MRRDKGSKRRWREERDLSYVVLSSIARELQQAAAAMNAVVGVNYLS
jgi:hypothetical protein